MSSRTRLLALAASTPLVILVMVGGLLGAARPATGQQGAEHLKVFVDVLRLTVGAYVEAPDVDKVMDGAMRGLTDGLDPLSSYLPPAEVRALQAKTPLPTADVGVIVSKQFYLRIVGVRDGSPAAKAGLRSGDFIRAIDDAATRDMSAHTGARLLAGAPGSRTTLLVLRANVVEPRPVDLVREVPATTRATGRRLPGGQAYVRVASFGPGAVDQIRTSVAALGSAANSGLVIDLRDTADGTPQDGAAAARLFVKTGTLSTQLARNAAPVVTAAASGDGALTMPVVLVVSVGTAHAAEVFAGALTDNKRATLVGTPTAGLAGTQTLVTLPDEHGLLLTTSRFMRADGTTPIHARGVRPDVLVELPLVAFDEAAPAVDAALARAVDALKNPPAPATTPAAPTAPQSQSHPPGAPTEPRVLPSVP